MGQFSFSKISAFRTCNKKFYYQYIEKVPTPSSKELLLGQLMHEILEKHYKAPGEVEEIFLRYEGFVNTGELDTHPNLLRSVYREYFHHYNKTEIILFNEQKFEIAFDEKEEDIFTGIVDKILDVNGTILLRDYKTTSGSLKYTTDRVRYNPQQLLYKEMAEILTDLSIDAIEIDEIRMDMLEEVPLNKNGRPTVDRRKLSLVTYETYFNTLVELGLEDDPDYENILEELHRRGHPLFKRTSVSLIEPSLCRVNLTDIEATMQQMKREKVFPRNPGRLCDWCAYKQICQFDYYEPSEEDREIIKRKL